MIVLALFFRELKLAVRRPATWWTRVALGAFGGLFVLAVAEATASPAKIGRNQFIALSYIGFVAALGAGIRYTAHSIGEEIREGTLGLLLLTRLRRIELVLGKIVGAVVESLASLLVILPLVSLPMIFGGVKWSDFGLVALVLPVTLLVALAGGVLTSAREGHELQGMMLTGLLLATICVPFGWLIYAGYTTRELLHERANAGGSCPWWLVMILWLPLLIMIIPAVQARDLEPLVWTGSPLGWLRQAHLQPSPPLAQQLWFGVQLLPVAVAFTLLAARRLPMLLEGTQDRPASMEPDVAKPGQTMVRRRRSHRPAELLARNPVAWLTAPEAWLGTLAWCSAALLAVFQFQPLADLSGYIAPWTGFGELAAELVFSYLVAWLASAHLRRARGTGELELLLCTPLSRRTVFEGFRRPVNEVFLMPLVLVLTFSVIAAAGMMASVQWRGSVELGVFGLMAIWLVGDLVGIALNFLALGWLGLWLGWSLRRPALAPAIATLAVVLVPWLVTMVVLPASLKLGGWAFWLVFTMRLLIWPLACLGWARARVRRTLLAGQPPPVAAFR